jgi:Fe2+ transport system protein B
MSHLATMLLFAVFASMALACLAQRSTSGRIRYAVKSFLLFVLIGIGIAWLMYPFSR